MKFSNSITITLTLLFLTNSIIAQTTENNNEYIPIIPLVEAELFGVDAAHSYLGFSIGFMGLNTVRGHFNRYDMAILYNEEDFTKLSVTLIIKAGSIDTRLKMRDKDLRGERFFEVDKYPHIMFQSNQVEKSGSGYIIHGDLTMRGVTKEVAIPVLQIVQRQKDLGWQNVRIGFEGRLTVNRKAYGVNGGNFWGDKALSDEVEIEFSILGNRFNLDKFSLSRGDKPSIGDTLWQVAQAKGGEAALALYHELKTNQPDAYNFSTKDILLVGRRLINHNQIDEGIEFCNIVLAIDPGNVTNHLALGEAYALKSDHEKAVKHYQKVLELTPDEPLAMEMLRQLEK